VRSEGLMYSYSISLGSGLGRELLEDDLLDLCGLTTTPRSSKRGVPLDGAGGSCFNGSAGNRVKSGKGVSGGGERCSG